MDARLVAEVCGGETGEKAVNRAVRANKFVNADSHGRPPAALALSAAAGYGQRYAALLSCV